MRVLDCEVYVCGDRLVYSCGGEVFDWLGSRVPGLVLGPPCIRVHDPDVIRLWEGSGILVTAATIVDGHNMLYHLCYRGRPFAVIKYYDSDYADVFDEDGWVTEALLPEIPSVIREISRFLKERSQPLCGRTGPGSYRVGSELCSREEPPGPGAPLGYRIYECQRH